MPSTIIFASDRYNDHHKVMKVLAHTKIAGIKSIAFDLNSIKSNLDKINQIRSVIGNMVATCVEENGIGLAAPQVGINKRLFIGINHQQTTIRPASSTSSQDSNKKEQTTTVDYTAYLNPSWTMIAEDGKETEQEGCLSVKTEQPLAISRYRSILASWYEIDFTTNQIIEMRAIRLTGMRARFFMHECEHLNGTNIVETHKRQQNNNKEGNK